MSCINQFESLFDDTISNVRSSVPGTIYIIKHPDGRELKADGDIVRLNRGQPLKFSRYTTNVYNKENGRIALFGYGKRTHSLRHGGSKVFVHHFGENSYDFAWAFWYISGNQYYIYNDYREDGDVTWLGYDSSIDQLVISKRFDPRTVLWTVEIYDDPRHKLRSLAFMQENNKQCVFPRETMKTLNFNEKCKLQSLENGKTLQDNFIESKDGCSIDPNNKQSMKQSILEVSHNGSISNNLALDELKKRLSILTDEVNSLWENILKDSKKFQKTLKKYQDIQDGCQGAQDVVDWAENTVFPEREKEIAIKYKNKTDITTRYPSVYKKYYDAYSKCENKVMVGWNSANSDYKFTSISASSDIICGITPGRSNSNNIDNNSVLCQVPGNSNGISNIISNSNWKNVTDTLKYKIKRISVDGKNACGIDTSGNIMCANDVMNGQWNYIHDGFKDVSLNKNKLCAITTYDQIVCGDYKNGNLENPKFVPGSLKQISIDENRACGINYDNAIWCADNIDNPQWTYVPGSLKQIEIKGNNMCGINDNNTISCAKYKTDKFIKVPGDFKHISLTNDTLYAISASNILENPNKLYSRNDI